MNWIEYQPHDVEAIATRLDLRDPNRRALHKVAQNVESGDGREIVCDLATGVGKTYLAAGLLEYLAEAGVRNIVMLVPLDAIYEKTIENFTPGTRKYIDGINWEPVVITSENFKQHVEVMDDQSQLKLYVFKVQSLLKPQDDSELRSPQKRKTHMENEHTGQALYARLQALDDLVVIADEHHVYSGDAERYGATMRDLGARVIVGLTATPNKMDVEAKKVVFRYSLAEAIADGLVKIPVIVYREDGTKDTHSQLADASHLRDVKEAAWRSYAQAVSRPVVIPVLFIVCEEVKQAEQVAEVLRAEFMPGPDQVLLITGGSSDKALRALKAVEDSDSPVRAVVSVDKLKEGWDVRNIGVIVSFRPLLSATLTEQVLGRGLRLPFGTRTSIEAVDTVDIVAHESYRQLLANKQALLEQVLEGRAGAAHELAVNSVTGPSGALDQSSNSSNGAAAVYENPLTLTFVFDDENADASVFMKVQKYESTVSEQQKGAASTIQFLTPVSGAPRVRFPLRTRKAVPTKFSLSLVTEEQAKSLGRRYLSDDSVYMKRIALDAQRGIDDEVVIGERFLDEEKAYLETLSWSEVKTALETKVLGLNVIESTITEYQAATEVIGWFLEGAGVTGSGHAEWSVRRTNLATRAIEALIVKAYELRATTPTWDIKVIEMPLLPPTRTMPTPRQSKWSEFAKGLWYEGWQNSIEPVASLDAKTTEWVLTQLLDSASSHIDWWLRIYSHGPIWIEWDGGRYFPDFIAIDKRGIHWVIESKADDDANDPAVVSKRQAADEWVAAINADASFGQWRYLFVTESHLKAANGRWVDLLRFSSS